MHGAFSAIAERLVSVTSLAEQTQTERHFIQTTGRPDVMLLGGIFLSLLEKKTFFGLTEDTFHIDCDTIRYEMLF